MSMKKFSKNHLLSAIFGCFFVFLGLFGLMAPSTPVFADPVPEETTTEATPEATAPVSGDTCKTALGSIGWLVCPTVEKISDAVDWLYEKIEDILVINPVEASDNSPIYSIWKYCRDITNIVFIIFLLIVVYSQITGMGINNYGIKKALPKLIIAAILVNLSFVICSLAVDVSNIIGQSLRGVFESVEQASLAAMGGNVDTQSVYVSYSQLYSALAGGSVLAIAGGVIAFETGSIWMLIPVVLGAIVAVASGLITIALRQAVVALLIMISPLAMVAYILPNTEQYFKKWKNLLTRMLVFYPLFSLLFGASSLAGWAIIASAKDGFGLLLGLAVQIFPLFFSWSLMRMSGTFLGTINERMRGLASRPLATNRAWADSHRQLTKQKYLASNNAYTPSLRLTQFIANRKIARDAETSEAAETAKNRGLAYAANKHYRADGTISRKGEKSYERQARNMQYQRTIARDKNNFNKGLGQIGRFDRNGNLLEPGKDAARNASQRARLAALDLANVDASDSLKYELSRGTQIDFENARGFQERTSAAINAHMDQLHAGELKYRTHDIEDRAAALARYSAMSSIMENNAQNIHFAAADAAYNFNAQRQVIDSRFRSYFDLTAPTQDVVHRLGELTHGNRQQTNDQIDAIIAGMKVLNQRGDTDLVRRVLNDALIDLDGNRKIQLGTYSSQALANFLMFEVKDNDPFMRRFGKYINLQTAQIYNDKDPAKRRYNTHVDMDEYVNGEYDEYDQNGQPVLENGKPRKVKVKSNAAIEHMLEGTSYKNMERTAISNMIEGIRDASYDTDAEGRKTFNYEKFKKNQSKVWGAIMPNIISDQFNYLSGSEQIKSLAKGITGTSNHNIDWEGIFGDEAANLTPEQKKDYLDYLNKRVSGSFLKGHVPNQIGRTKSDMLGSVMDLLTLTSASEKSSEAMGKILSGKVKEEDYKSYTEQYGRAADDKLINSFDEKNIKGFLKMYHKGYQGDAKANLAEHLHADELYDKFFPFGEQRRSKTVPDDDEEDGLPVDGDVFQPISPIRLAECRKAVDDLYASFGPNSNDVSSFFSAVATTLNSVVNSPEAIAEFDALNASLSQYPTVATVYNRIMDILNNL